MTQVLLAGFGELAQALAKKWQHQRSKFLPIALARTAKQLAQCPQFLSPIESINFEKLENFLGEKNIPLNPNYAVITLTPSERTADAYQHTYCDVVQSFVSNLTKHFPQVRILYVSSTRVLKENNGEWVDESSPVNLYDPFCKALLCGEQSVLNANQKNCVVRFSGIYGPTRLMFKTMVTRKDDRLISRDNPWTNRIHQDDCVNVLDFLLQKMEQNIFLPPVIHATDEQPIQRMELVNWLREKFQLPRISYDKLTDSEGKRISNQALKDLGFKFEYSSYKEG